MKLSLNKYCRYFIAFFIFFPYASFLHSEEVDPTDVSFVSINPYTNEVSVAWYKSESANIKYARILYIYDETTLIKGKGIADISGNSDTTITFHTDSISAISFEVNEKPLSIAVDAYSENGSNSTSLKEYHTTMIARAKTLQCPSRIQISWTKYYGYNQQVTSYDIIEVTQEGEKSIAHCSGEETSCFVELNEQQERHFFIRATFTDCRGKTQTSTSNLCQVSGQSAKMPQFIRIENVSREEKTTTLTCHLDTESDYRSYIIFVSEKDTNQFVGIDTLQLTQNSNPIYTFQDTNSYEPHTNQYYRIAVYDNCNDIIRTSTTVSPITLTARELDELQNILEWTPTNTWEETFQYRILRTDNYGNEYIIDSTNNTTYIDNLENNYKHNYSQTYRIEAIEKEEDGYHAYSNTATITKDFKILIPNAFNPFSNIRENTVFKPKYKFISGDYELKIFDRFGTCIYTSNNIDEGWDGIHNGENAPEGMYQYTIKITISTGENIERHGIVNLIYK